LLRSRERLAMLFRVFRKSKNRAAEQIEQLLQHLGMLAELAEEGMLVADSKGFVHFVNTAWATMHGYRTSRELIGREIRMFHTPEQMKSDMSGALKHLQHLRQYAGYVGHVRNDGTVFRTSMKMRLLKNSNDETVGFLAVAVDTSAASQVAHNLQTTATQAETGDVQEQQAETHPGLQEDQAQLREQLVALSAANETHRSEIARLEQAERELQEYIDRLEDQVAKLRTECEASVVQQPDDEYTDDSLSRAIVLDSEKLKVVADMAKKLR